MEGTSRLYIDFNPSDEGVSGQKILFVHHLEQYKAVANSFGEYLPQLLDGGYFSR